MAAFYVWKYVLFNAVIVCFILFWVCLFFSFCATTPSSVLYCIMSDLTNAERLFLIEDRPFCLMSVWDWGFFHSRFTY